MVTPSRAMTRINNGRMDSGGDNTCIAPRANSHGLPAVHLKSTPRSQTANSTQFPRRATTSGRAGPGRVGLPIKGNDEISFTD